MWHCGAMGIMVKSSVHHITIVWYVQYVRDIHLVVVQLLRIITFNMFLSKALIKEMFKYYRIMTHEKVMNVNY